ncbi:MAG: hypothetical protein QXS37_03380 [Candidatus Aenigmatarchaeota archaeon]
MVIDFSEMLTKAGNFLNTWFGGADWVVASVISLFIFTTVVGLIYFLSSLFQSERLKRRADEELRELYSSILIFSLTFSVIGILYAVTVSLSPSGINYIENAKNFFYNQEDKTGIFYSSFRAAYNLITQVSAITIISTAQVNLINYIGTSIKLVGEVLNKIPTQYTIVAGSALNLAGDTLKLISQFFNITFSPFASFNLLVDPLEELFSIAMMNSYAAYIQYTLLDFLTHPTFQIIFPLGLFLRCFPISRRTGSTLIAISLVGMIFYPLSVNLSQMIYNDLVSIFGRSELYIPSLEGGIGVYLIHPDEGSQIIDEPIEWEIISPNEKFWRVWKKVKCSDLDVSQDRLWNCTCGAITTEGRTEYVPQEVILDDGTVAQIYVSKYIPPEIKEGCICNGTERKNEQPPIDNPLRYLGLHVKTLFQNSLEQGATPSIYEAESCYRLIINGTGEYIEFYPRKYGIDDTVATLMVDAYDYDGNSYTPIGIEESTFIVGHPCKGFKTAQCLQGVTMKVTEEISGGSGSTSAVSGVVGTAASGVYSGVIDFLKDIMGKGAILPGAATGLAVAPGIIPMVIGIAYTPSMAGIMYLNFGSTIPPILVPVLGNVISIVLALIISITGFRSVSLTLGGETRILGLAKIV